MAPAPKVTILVPSMLRARCGVGSELTVEAASVRGALDAIARSHPSLHGSVCDETGAVRPHVNLFVNASHVRDLAGLDTRLAPGDVLTIHPAVSGG